MLKRIHKETNIKKIKVVPLSKTKFRVILGPFNDINSLKKKFAETKRWANNEQAGMKSATDDVIKELAHYNDIYEKKMSSL